MTKKKTRSLEGRVNPFGSRKHYRHVSAWLALRPLLRLEVVNASFVFRQQRKFEPKRNKGMHNLPPSPMSKLPWSDVITASRPVFSLDTFPPL